MTHLCVPIFVTDAAAARRDIATAIEAGADLVELRIDKLEDISVVDELLDAHVGPRAIITRRSKEEGGFWPMEDEARAARIWYGLPAERYGYIDLELATIKRHPTLLSRRPECTARRILSAHFFGGRPERLYNLVQEMNAVNPDMIKIVWTARTIRDNLEAFELIRTAQRPTIALCMGEAGLISRVLAKKFGAFLTFASLDAGAETAPGQLTIADMKGLYRWDKIGPATKVFGVVADPVRHSMSPAIHNAAFDATGFDGIYLPMLVEKSFESFKAFFESFLHAPGMDLSGVSVTIPHKENALKYLREKGAEIEPLAEAIGAVNTIAVKRSGEAIALHGFNTDYAAILDSITEAMDISRHNLKGLRVGVLGAGGTGRTAVAALSHFGAKVLVSNRTHERAEELADEFGAEAVSTADLIGGDCRVIINATSVGMFPNAEANPLGDVFPQWPPDVVVFDTIYNPMQTRLLRQAKAAGMKTISGVEMFVRQAAAQFEIWTGLSAPKDIMRDVVERRLG